MLLVTFNIFVWKSILIEMNDLNVFQYFEKKNFPSLMTGEDSLQYSYPGSLQTKRSFIELTQDTLL